MSASILPGHILQEEQLPKPSKTSKSLTLGPGLRFTPPSTITATVPGQLQTDDRKNAVWLENSGQGRYIPTVGDLVIAQVHHSATEMWYCSLSPYTSHAALAHLAFEGVSRKTRPQLEGGALVYARVSSASKHMEPEIECVHPSTGKAEGLGELKGGTVFDISLGMARRLMLAKQKESGGVAVLEEFGEQGAKFEIAVGRNGKIWINSTSVRLTVAIGKAVTETDETDLDIKTQVRLVRTLMKSIG